MKDEKRFCIVVCPKNLGVSRFLFRNGWISSAQDTAATAERATSEWFYAVTERGAKAKAERWARKVLERESKVYTYWR